MSDKPESDITAREYLAFKFGVCMTNKDFVGPETVRELLFATAKRLGMPQKEAEIFFANICLEGVDDSVQDLKTMFRETINKRQKELNDQND